MSAKESVYITLGSLFDGIGGFPYAGSFFGITPVWASEIMPTAVSVTQRHFPEMEHVGDITQLSGAKLAPVDIITFGSPCQDLSVANGNRLGLAGARSGLFMEAIRIIQEMREATNGKYPRYALWENVVGATSSGKPAGSDFKAVLEAFTETKIPFPRSGKWANAGMVRGGGVDLAWVTYCASRFGTAQRRRRIFLVVDFSGFSSGKILFIPRGLRGYFAAGGTPRQGPAAYAAGGAAGADQPANDIGFDGYNGDLTGRHAATLGANCGMSTGRNGVLQSMCLNPWDVQSSRVHTADGTSPTLAGADGSGGRNPAGLVLTAAFTHKAGSKARSIGYEEERSPTLTSNIPALVVLNDQGGSRMDVEKGDQSPTLRSVTKGNLPVICRATALANAETLVERSATLTCYHEQPIICKAVHQNQEGDVSTSDTAYTLSTASNASARNAPLVMTETYAIAATAIGRQPHNGGNGLGVKRELCPTITAMDRHAIGGAVHPDVSGTLCASGAGTARAAGNENEVDLCVAYSLQGSMIGWQEGNGPKGSGVGENISYTLDTREPHAVASAYIVRRLLPIECERLMGFPDNWTAFGHDDKPISDSKRYQMLGNSIATPCAAYILQAMAEELRKEAD